MIWTIALVAIAFITLLVGIVTPIIKLNTVITRLSAIVDNIGKNLNTLANKNSDTHERIWGELGKQGNELADHEARIFNIEKQK